MQKSMWTVTPGAWTQLVDVATLEKAQQRTRDQSDERLLADLRRLLATGGFLSEKLNKSSHAWYHPRIAEAVRVVKSH
jgi:hypothetical protein